MAGLIANLSANLRRHLPISGLALLLTALFLSHSGELFHSSVLQQLENMLYDARIVLTLPNTPDSSIVIVDIDDDSLAQIGRWPWSAISWRSW